MLLFIGTPATQSQLAKDVTTFLTWAGEPYYDSKKALEFKVHIMRRFAHLSQRAYVSFSDHICDTCTFSVIQFFIYKVSCVTKIGINNLKKGF